MAPGSVQCSRTLTRGVGVGGGSGGCSPSIPDDKNDVGNLLLLCLPRLPSLGVAINRSEVGAAIHKHPGDSHQQGSSRNSLHQWFLRMSGHQHQMKDA